MAPHRRPGRSHFVIFDKNDSPVRMQAIALTIPPNINVFSDDELYAFCLANPELRIERDEIGHIIIMPPLD